VIISVLIAVIIVLFLQLARQDTPVPTTTTTTAATPLSTTTVVTPTSTTTTTVPSTTTATMSPTTIESGTGTTAEPTTTALQATTTTHRVTTSLPPSTTLPSRLAAADASPGAKELFCQDVQAVISAIALRQVGSSITIPCHGYLDLAEELICPNLGDESSVDAMAQFLTLMAGTELEWPEGLEPKDQEIELLMETWVGAASQYLCPETSR